MERRDLVAFLVGFEMATACGVNMTTDSMAAHLKSLIAVAKVPETEIAAFRFPLLVWLKEANRELVKELMKDQPK